MITNIYRIHCQYFIFVQHPVTVQIEILGQIRPEYIIWEILAINPQTLILFGMAASKA